MNSPIKRQVTKINVIYNVSASEKQKREIWFQYKSQFALMDVCNMDAFMMKKLQVDLLESELAHSQNMFVLAFDQMKMKIC